MKKYLFIFYIIGVAILGVVGYLFFKKKNTNTANSNSGTSSTNTSNLLSLLGFNNTTSTETGTTTGTENQSTSPLATGLLNYQYNGQALYGMYNNVAKPSDSIGYTSTGVSIKIANVEWSESQKQYIDKNSSGSVVQGPSGLQQYTYNGQSLYNFYDGVPLASNVVGYLYNGTKVYRFNVVFVNGEWRDDTSGYELV